MRTQSTDMPGKSGGAESAHTHSEPKAPGSLTASGGGQAEAGSHLGLDIRGLRTRVAGREVLAGLDLQVERGSFVGLIGPNGAGKTTFIRSVLGLLPCTGEVRIDGRARGRRASAGYVPQKHEFAWDFPITIEDAVLTGKRFRLWQRPGVEDFRQVNEALDRVQLRELKDRPVAELSGGQRQRVLVARALVKQSSLLLLDEPFTGVDIPTQELLTQVLHELSAQGITVIMSTHDLVGAMSTCSHIAMLKGSIRAFGKPEDLRQAELWHEVFGLSPASPQLRALGIGEPAAHTPTAFGGAEAAGTFAADEGAQA